MALAIASLGGGCSFLFVEGAAEGKGPVQPETCTRSYAWPTVDVVLAALQLAGIVYYQGNGNQVLVTAQTSWAIVYTSSAIAGFKRVNGCLNGNSEQTGLRPPPPQLSSKQRKTEEAQEEAAVQARIREQEAEAARAAGEAARASQVPGAGGPGQPGK